MWLVVLLLLGTGIDSAEWQRLSKQAARLAARAGELEAKSDLVEAVAVEDSGRVATLLMELAAASVKRRDKLAPRLDSARSDFVKQSRRLRQKQGPRATRDELEKDSRWRTARERLDQVQADLAAAAGTIEAVGHAVRGLRSPEAIAVLADIGNRTVAQARQAVEIRQAIVEALFALPLGRAVEPLLGFAHDAAMPEQRARVLQWIGKHRLREGYEAAIASLTAKESAVARSGVAALRALDDPRCVPALIAARKGARGLFADDLEKALHRFTGESFFGVGADTMWAGWWRSHGQSWLASDLTKRYEPVAGSEKGGAEFYGITTRSDRIVFVLDRSYSMRLPVPQKGPITGKSKEPGLAGATKLEIAKSKLARTIRNLNPKVRFAVVAYSHEVHVWRDAPGMAPATPANKRDAIEWFMRNEPVGSTMIFDALDAALRYAKVGSGKSSTDPLGADTIFLLSDGAPTEADGVALLRGPALEDAIRGFLESNRAYRCVVHTIGIGPDHSRSLMERLARETGGTYKAVEHGTK